MKKDELFYWEHQVRGALNALLKIKESRRIEVNSQGHEEELEPLRVICQSSGNFAQGVSWAAGKCGFISEVVMPDNTLPKKKEAIEEYGGQVHFGPCSVKAQYEIVDRLISEYSPHSCFVPSSAHPDIIAGQGTIALELLEQVQDVDAIIASVGGGGMISGIGVVANAIQRDVKVFAAEPEDGDDCARSVAAGRLIVNETWPNTVCDSLRISINSVTLPHIMKFVNGVIIVTEEEIISAMKLIWQRMKLVIEPAAACAVAAALSPKFKQMAGPNVKKVGVVLCGGNLDLNQIPWTTNT